MLERWNSGGFGVDTVQQQNWQHAKAWRGPRRFNLSPDKKLYQSTELVGFCQKGLEDAGFETGSGSRRFGEKVRDLLADC